MEQKTAIIKELAETRIFRANAFVAPGCQGNAAGICVLDGAPDEQFYKDTAVKLDCAETAFVYEKNEVLYLRWFTCTGAEVDLCGHATLALSWVLWESRYVFSTSVIYYQTRSGTLSARLKGQDVFMDFPLVPVIPLALDYPLEAWLGVKTIFTGKAGADLLVQTASEDDVKNLKPDLSALKTIPVRGVIVTAPSRSKEYDFVSRFFAPSIGIPEDPVTGSAHCALADFWGKKLHKTTMTGYQVSPEGGMVGVSVNQDRVTLSGKVQQVPVTVRLK